MLLGHINGFTYLNLTFLLLRNLSKYVAEKIGIDDSLVKCFKLVKTDATNLRYVNFKVGIPSNNYKVALNGSNWPKNCIVREKIQKTPRLGP